MEPQQPSSASPPPATPPSERRTSMEEDYFYRDMMSVPKKPTEPPPAYASAVKKTLATQKRALLLNAQSEQEPDSEALPDYSCSIHAEGAFQRKMEIEQATKRAPGRHWGLVYVSLHGTALSVHAAQKDWSFRKAQDGPHVAPDRPPWLRAGALLRRYSLAFADVGIAADYRKRRYVLRVRAESDQFLLACVELATLVRWLDALFAAIAVAAPIDDMEFPRDQSIPRVQRLRWLRTAAAAAGGRGNQSAGLSPVSSAGGPAAAATAAVRGPPVAPHIRLSTTSRPNEGVDAETGKWRPGHVWTAAHDLIYARLCYAVLLFRSPRKSNYIVMKGKQWFVDWATGNMFRVAPPRYGEVELYGPWQAIRTENMRL